MNKLTVSAVVATGSNNAIGKNNQLLWHLPADLKHFKNITTGHTVIMGRKTFDSIGKPLPNRRNIIVTRQAIQIQGCEVASSVEAALGLCTDETEVMICGGAEIYRLALPLTNRIYLTIVKKDFDADAYFPALKPGEWVETSHEDYEPDAKNPLPYAFITLERR